MPIEFKRLTREEELAAWERGDHDALVESIWPFVLKIAQEIRPKNSATYDELLSVAGLTITKALKTFDPHKARFITYACEFLRYRMHKEKEAFERPGSKSISPLVATPPSREIELIDAVDEYEAAIVKLRIACTSWQLEVMTRRANGETHEAIASTHGLKKQSSQLVYCRGIENAKAALISEPE